MIRFAVVLVWLLAASLLLASCRGDDSAKVAIVEPSEVAKDDFYPVVALIYSATIDPLRKPRCTGVLIDSDIVLTAAHCACGSLKPNNIYIGWDEPNRIGAGYYPVELSRVSAAGACRNGSTSGRLKPFRDFALLPLSRKVVETQPVPIADDLTIDKASSYRIVGFGATDPQGKNQPGRKYQGQVDALSNDCIPSGGSNPELKYRCHPKEEIVAGSANGTDACKGDSGGPLLVASDGTAGPPTLGKLKVAGIVSRGVTKRCGDGAIYERLDASAREWIRREVQRIRVL